MARPKYWDVVIEADAAENSGTITPGQIEEHLFRCFRIDHLSKTWLSAGYITDQLQQDGLLGTPMQIQTLLGIKLRELGIEKKRKTGKRITCYRGLVRK